MKLWSKTFQLTWKFRFAHHPLCEQFDDHVWQISSLFICQGCTLVFLGFLTGSAIFLLTGINLEPTGWLIIGIICFSLPSGVELLGIADRRIKRTSRWIIGFGLNCFFWSLITIPDLVVQFTAFATLFASFYLFKKIRSLKNSHGDLCEGCSELTRGGICTGLQQEAEAMRKYSDYATQLLEDKLRQRVLSKYQRTGNGNFKNNPDS